MRSPFSGANEGGAVLLVSLLVLLLLGIIATTVAGTSQLQLHMAGNDETRIAAMQQALAAVDGVLALPSNLSANVPVGHRNCTARARAGQCDEYTLSPDPAALPAAGELELAVVRVAPAEAPVPVTPEDVASSAIHYRVAKFEVQVAYDGSAQGGGRAVLAQGVLVRVPVSLQSGGVSP